MHPAEGSVFEIKGVLDYAVQRAELSLAGEPTLLKEDQIEDFVRRPPLGSSGCHRGRG